MPKCILDGELDIEPLISARNFLAEALQEAKTKLEIAGAIQAFEVCYELTWKTLKKVLFFHGVEASNARETFRLAAQQGWIFDPKVWFVYLKKRNVTVHEYQEQIMEKVYPVLPQFLENLNSLIRKLEKF